MKPNPLTSLSAIAAAVSIAALAACASKTAFECEVGEGSSSKSVITISEKPLSKDTPDPANPTQNPSWEDTYASLLKKYVTPTGVRYAAWKANPGDLAELKTVVEAIAAAPGKDADLAFYLNAYNAWILNNVLADYPVKGVGGGNALGRSAFFGGNRITVAGQKTSFNDLENAVVRKRFKEPRIHFALNCASAGCPPLMDRPFRASSLDADLSRLTRDFVSNNPEGVRKTSEGAYSLSEIFTWFEEDFGDVVTFINRYRSEPIPADAKIGSHDYDWSLNEAK